MNNKSNVASVITGSPTLSQECRAPAPRAQLTKAYRSAWIVTPRAAIVVSEERRGEGNTMEPEMQLLEEEVTRGERPGQLRALLDQRLQTRARPDARAQRRPERRLARQQVQAAAHEAQHTQRPRVQVCRRTHWVLVRIWLFRGTRLSRITYVRRTITSALLSYSRKALALSI